MKVYRPYYIAVLGAILVLLVGRLFIAGQGYLNDTDELLYLYIIHNYGSLIHFDIHPWVQAVFDMQGQPPEIAIRLVQSLFAYEFSHLTGLPMTDPGSIYIIGLFNIIISLLILFEFFRIVKKLGFSDTLSLLGTILLGSLANMNIYIRHILPYDSALLFQLLALDVLLNKPLTSRHILMAGVFSALGLTNYFGCFMFVFIHLGVILLNNFHSLLVFSKKALLFSIPFVLLITIYEIVTRHYTGKSYLAFVMWYTDTINQGSFSEGLTYIFIYFALVEKWWGITLLCFFFVGLYMAYSSKEDRLVKNVLFLAVSAYLVYGCYVVFYEKMVFFGRVLHIYYPFVVIGVLYFIKRQRILNPMVLMTFMIFFSLLNYGFVIKDLNAICYPRSAIYQYGLFEKKGRVNFSYQEELFAGIRYEDRSEWYIDSIGDSKLTNGNYKLINFCFFKHHPDDFISTYKKYRTDESDSVIFEKVHFQSHPIYTFEYCDEEGRNFFLDRQFKVRILKTKVHGTIQ